MPKKEITVCVLLILIGFLILSWDYFLEKKNEVYDTMFYEISSLPSYVEKEDVEEVEEPEKSEDDIPSVSDIFTNNDNTNDTKVYNQEDFLGRLSIPKIKFNRNFYKIGSKENYVDKNIQVMKGSSMPDVDNGNLIIAGHSGTAYFSYFKNLYKLKKGNNAYVYYNGNRYTYEIVDIYNVKKNGTIIVKRNRTKRGLTLITCTKNSRTMQTVYILEQTKVEEM